jgi:4-amino-4-deoxy-L-arabinose transferase-like glycosyltransferase
LSYHEALVGQGAREMLASGDWLVPTLGGRPWLEKPPLGHWLAAGIGAVAGGVDATVARAPSAVAAVALALVVAGWAGSRFGARVGLIAGVVQATSAWWVARGRLAVADMLVAALVTGALVAFDGVRKDGRGRRLLFLLLGATGLAKGVGFGAGLVGIAALGVLLWDRDGRTARRLVDPVGVALALLVMLAWPLGVLGRHPEAGELWWGHLGGRFGAAAGSPRFAGEGWAEYLATPWVGMLPWTPLVVVGAIGSWRRARVERFGGDRLLWAWALGPSAAVSLSSARNGHYLLPMLPPLAVWGAMGVVRVGEALAARRGLGFGSRRAAGVAGALALAWGVGFAAIGPVADGRGKGAEWRWYEDIGRRLGKSAPVVLLYDAADREDRWDRAPYATPFGEVPPDLGARLFHLGAGRRVSWCAGVSGLGEAMRRAGARHVIGRERDLAGWTIVERSPGYRADRTYCVAEAPATRLAAIE